MSDAPITNPGRSVNVAKQTSLADAIAANLTASRQGDEVPQPQQQPKPEPEPRPRAPEPVAEPEPAPEPAAAETQAEGEVPDAIEAPDEAPERFTLADFAEAAEIDVEALADQLEVEVTGQDGTERASLKDVLNGYRWNAANTQRAQEIAEQRRQLDGQLEQINADHTRLNALLGVQFQDVEAEEQALDQQYRAVNWAGLQARADGSYADQEAQFSRSRQDLQRRKDKLAGAWQTAQQQATELAERQQAENLPRAREQMLTMIPEWRDEKRAMAESADVTRYVSESFGVTPEEQSKIADPRVIAAMRRLWVLDKQATGVPLAAKKVKTAPKAMTPGRAAAKQGAREETRKKLAGRLKRSGKRSDLAALILEGRRT